MRSTALVAIVTALTFSVAGAQTLAPLQADAAGRVTYFIAPGQPGSGFRDTDRELATWALGAWERALEGMIRFEPADEANALIQIHWVGPAGGQYGEVRPLLVRGRRGAAVYIRPDTDALGEQIARLARTDPLLRDSVVYLTCVHEFGHALGLEHTSQYGDIMYFFGYGGDIPGFFTRYRSQLASRRDIVRTSGIGPEDVKRVRALYAPKSGSSLRAPR